MNDMRKMLEESVNRLFSEQLDWDKLTAIEEQGWPAELWQQVEEQGTALVMASEAAGGLDGGWADAYPVLRAVGRHAVPLPVAESMVAHWLAKDAGIDLPAGVLGIVTEGDQVLEGDSLRLTNARVPWGRQVDHLVSVISGQVVVASASALDVTPEDNIGLDPRDHLSGKAPVIAAGDTELPEDAMRWLGALMRSAQIAGGAAACVDLATQYASEREQFGRSLSKFQIIQHYLADLAGNVASIDAMAMAACEALDQKGLSSSDVNARFEIAAAKCRASDGVETITKLAHQIHGAIGFTYEYGLHFVTRRMWSWRVEFGGVSAWGEELGRVAVNVGGDGIWPVITG
ncbi:MAG: acyl-CoA dehydrogenase family protein [Pseudomonadota bacterium]